jgi:two-component system, LytTR family, sensor kinase
VSIRRYLKKHEWPWHVAFWLIYLLLRMSVIQLYPGTFRFRLSLELLELPLKMLSLYFAIYVLIKQLLLRKKYTTFIAAFAGYLLVIMFVNRLEDFYLIYPLTKSKLILHGGSFWDLRASFFNLVYLYPVTGLGAAFYFIKNWYENKLETEQLAREKAEIELKLLKDQVHPHFLFNTLNNIYSLSLQQSPKAPDMMLKLSHLLSYMLYETSTPYVPLCKEIEVLKDYVALEKIRFDKRLEITFDVAGEVNGLEIAPLLLFPLLENSFKHAAGKTLDPVWISFHLLAESQKLTVQVENSLPTVQKRSDNNGIGLPNLKKQLSYLYPDAHQLNIYHHDTFLVRLTIDLNVSNLRNNRR